MNQILATMGSNSMETAFYVPGALIIVLTVFCIALLQSIPRREKVLVKRRRF